MGALLVPSRGYKVLVYKDCLNLAGMIGAAAPRMR
jgi:hypothetical protein